MEPNATNTFACPAGIQWGHKSRIPEINEVLNWKHFRNTDDT